MSKNSSEHHTLSVGHAFFGDPQGIPVLFLHTTPGSHRQAQLIHPLAQKKGICILSIDRFGYGASQPWTASVDLQFQALNDLFEEKGWTHFHVMAWGGAQHFAFELKSRMFPQVKSLDIFSAFPPSPIPSIFTILVSAYVMRLMLSILFFLIRPEKIMVRLISRLCAKDKELLFDPFVQKIFLESMALENQQGYDGLALDCRDQFQKQKIPIAFECVRFWHGSKDHLISLKKLKRWLLNFPNISLEILKDEGHFSCLIRGCDQFFTRLKNEDR